MASYTMQLREIIEMYSQDEELSIKDRIEKGRVKLFDFDYPIFDASYKKVFETHIIRKFYMREIGFETEYLFKFNLESWLSINMTYYNKLFESELIVFDPLVNAGLKVTNLNKVTKNQTQDSTTDGTNKNTTTNTDTTTVDADGTLIEDNFDRQLSSENPDIRLALTTLDGQGVIEYAKDIKENNENNSKTSSNNSTNISNGSGTNNDTSNVIGHATATINETEDFLENRTGKIGTQSYSKMIQEYRDSFLRIENKIHNEMQELFMLVY